MWNIESNLYLIAISCLGLVIAMPTAAENQVDRSIELAPRVVTATRDGQDSVATPYSVQLFSGTALRHDLAPRTLPELFDHEPGVMVQKTGYGQGSPYIRGFTGYRNLFLVDNVRLNNSVFRDGPNQYWNTVDPLSLSSVDLVRGPAAVLYGSGAVGGTVSATTRGAEDLREDSDWDRLLYTRLSSAESSHIARAETTKMLAEGLYLSLGYSHRNYGDLRGGSDVGRQRNTGYEEQGWDLKLEYFTEHDGHLTMAHQGFRVDDAWRTHATIYGIDWKGLTVGSDLRRSFDQERYLTYLQYRQNLASALVDSFHLGVSHQRQSEEQNRLRSGDRHEIQGFDVDTYGIFAILNSKSPLGQLVYGVEYYHDDVSTYRYALNADGSVRSRAIQGPVGDDSSYDTVGLFVQDRFEIGARSELTLGARYEWAEADARRVQNPETGGIMQVSQSWSDLVGSARFTVWLDEQREKNIFTGISQGFRAPNLSDLTHFNTARTDEIETPVSDLDAENYVTAEIGFKIDIERLGAQIAYYYTDIDGMIVRTPTGRVIDGSNEVTKRNAGDGYVQGAELSLRYSIRSDLSARMALSWMDGKVDTYPSSEAVIEREYMDRLMPPTGSLAIRWRPAPSYWVEGRVRAAAKADRLSSRDAADTSRIPYGGTPGYAVYDLRAGYVYADALKLGVALENIADTDYRIHGSGVNEAGRNLILTAEVKF